MYFPHGTPDWWLWDSHIASRQEQRSSSWGGVAKIVQAGVTAYQVVQSNDLVIP